MLRLHCERPSDSSAFSCFCILVVQSRGPGPLFEDVPCSEVSQQPASQPAKRWLPPLPFPPLPSLFTCHLEAAPLIHGDSTWVRAHVCACVPAFPLPLPLPPPLLGDLDVAEGSGGGLVPRHTVGEELRGGEGRKDRREQRRGNNFQQKEKEVDFSA